MSAVDSTKPPVVLIHGMWSTAETLSELRQAFEEQGYVVHAPTLPYHKEKSAYDEGDKARLARASLQDYVDFIVARLVELHGACHWTVGGSNFPRVRSSIFNWLENKTA
ncbi:esterase/lipase family protein [Microbulbifer mangrovi]|uniref:esterase/lipase family protein n=1 Tax=Microbulbifer mangrovi TaxID=927787 RepID=UPI00099037ED|nr:alpha/beta hydrolase [Microbulbifer mangrovi]